MAAFTLNGLVVSIALAFVTTVVVAPAVNIIINTATQHLFASIKSAIMSASSVAGLEGVSKSTPVLKAQSGENLVPALNLDNVNLDTALITASPYAQNEGLTFSKGTSLWQPQAGVQPSLQKQTQGPPAIISESSFDRNEGLKFTPGTSLWQPTSFSTIQQQASAPSLWAPSNAGEWKTTSSAPFSMRSMTAPLPASNLITQPPFCSNEGIKIPAGTSMWRPGSTAAFKTPASTGKPSLITSSSYGLNEIVTFPKGTLLWQPKAKATDKAAFLTRSSRSCTLFFAPGP
ncbi:hypothetical protein MBLNU13_g03846t1 [Cladosporium sp. NU13]